MIESLQLAQRLVTAPVVGRRLSSVDAADRFPTVATDLLRDWHTNIEAVIPLGTPLAEDPDRIVVVVPLDLDETPFYRQGHRQTQFLAKQSVAVDHSRTIDVAVARNAGNS